MSGNLGIYILNTQNLTTTFQQMLNYFTLTAYHSIFRVDIVPSVKVCVCHMLSFITVTSIQLNLIFILPKRDCILQKGSIQVTPVYGLPASKHPMIIVLMMKSMPKDIKM